MKKLILLAAFAAVSAGAGAQDIKSDNLQDFSRVSFSGKLNVVLEKSDRNAIEIKLTESSIEKLTWGIADGALKVRLRPASQRLSSGEVVVYYRSISSVEVSGASVRFTDTLRSGIFTASVSSGGKLSANVASDDVTVSADGNSTVSIGGAAKYLDVSATVKSMVDMRRFEARAATVRARYGGQITVNATEKLDVTSGSGSSVYYMGNPEILKISEKMLGTISQAARD